MLQLMANIMRELLIAVTR